VGVGKPGIFFAVSRVELFSDLGTRKSEGPVTLLDSTGGPLWVMMKP